MGSRLHLKHTSPEEAFVVQSEERRRAGDSFNRLDLNGKRDAIRQMVRHTSKDVHTSVNVSACSELSATAAISAMLPC